MKFPQRIFLLIIICNSLHAQIKKDYLFETQDGNFHTREFSVSQDAGLVEFEQLETKLFFFDLNTEKLEIYNLDYQLFKTIEIKYDNFSSYKQYGSWSIVDKVEILWPSQYLFDSDDGIEFILYTYSQHIGSPVSLNNFSLNSYQQTAIQIDPFSPYEVEKYDESGSRNRGAGTILIVDDDGSIKLEKYAQQTIKMPEIVHYSHGAKLFIPLSNRQIEVYSLPGKFSTSDSSDGSSSKSNPKTEVSLFDITNLKAGSKITLHNVQFDQSSYEIRNDAYPELDELFQLMLKNPSLKIRLEGHTDNQGVAKLNMELSKKRVEAIKRHLTDKGINKKRIEIIGYGQTKPIASNANENTRKLNRRVEMVVLSN